MVSIDEKRVYDASEGPTPVYVVGEFGVARVDTSGDLVGEFRLARKCSARDAAGRDGRVAVATDEDVLVGVAGSEDESDTAERAADGRERFEALGVGPAVAVGFDGDGRLLVAREDGAVVRGDAFEGSASERSASEYGDGENWTELGEIADVRAIDGDFVAAESGVYRATGTVQSPSGTAGGGTPDPGLGHVGLEDARDVSAAGVPLAATGNGLYKLGNGWMTELDGLFRAVSAADPDGGALGRAHAAGEAGLFAHEGGGWHDVTLPVAGDVVAIDHGENGGAYAATSDGTFLLSAGDGWNHQILGLRGVRAVAAP